jgi:hypothetical protein
MILDLQQRTAMDDLVANLTSAAIGASCRLMTVNHSVIHHAELCRRAEAYRKVIKHAEGHGR